MTYGAIPEQDNGPTSLTNRELIRERRQRSIAWILVVVGSIAILGFVAVVRSENRPVSTVPLLGKRRHEKYHLPNVDQRVIEDTSYIDVALPCATAFFSDLFHNILNIFEAEGIDDAQEVAPNMYHYTFGGMDVKAYVDFDDENMICTLIMLEGFNIFETLTEHIVFQPLPRPPHEAAGRAIALPHGDKKHKHLTEGCRIERTYIAILPAEKAAFTVEEFLEDVDPELIQLRDLLEAEAASSSTT